METITQKQWTATPPEYKSIIDGVRHVLKYDEEIGTKLVPVKVIKSFVVMFKTKEELDNLDIGPAQAFYEDEDMARAFLKSVEEDGGRGMMTTVELK